MIILGKTKRLLLELKAGIFHNPPRLSIARKCLAAVAVGCLATSASANPTGPTVRHGQVKISPGAQTQIQQLTDKAIVDWNSFSIGHNEMVQILQPSNLSVILNRVTGADPSVLMGTLTANGNVFLINQNGILFGPESIVNVGGLVASTLDIADADFLSGNYSFAQASNADLRAVVNQGKITISPGGYAVLTAPTVINEGTIIAQAGKVVLAAGERSTLNLDGRDLVHFTLGDQMTEGTVLLAPGMMSEAIATTLGVAPGRQANQLVRADDGSVRLTASSGTLVHSGTVNVNGAEGENGGSVLLDSTDLTLVDSAAKITASGEGLGTDGGQILVLSEMRTNGSEDGYTHVAKDSLLEARGGKEGQGGFLEVSGKRVNFLGDFDLATEDGLGGSLVLDPKMVKIIDGTDPLTMRDADTMIIGDEWFELFNSAADFTLSSLGGIEVDLSDAGTGANGDTTVNFARGGTNNTTIRLVAGTDISENGDIDFGSGYSFVGLNQLYLTTTGDIFFQDAVINTSNQIRADVDGDIDFGSSTITTAAVTATQSNVFDAGGDINLGTSSLNFDQTFFSFDPLDTTFLAGGSVTSGAADNTAGSYTASLIVGGNVSMTATNGSILLPDLDLQTPAPLTGDDITLVANNGAINLGESRLLAGGGDLVVTAGQTLTLVAADLRSELKGGVGLSLTAGLDVQLGDSTLNTVTVPAPSSTSTGSLTIVSTGGGIDFGDSQVRMSGGGSSGGPGGNDFDVTALNDINFASATLDLGTRGNTSNQITSTTGDILLGTSEFVTDSSDAAGHTFEFTANGSIRSGLPADNNPSTYHSSILVDGHLILTATDGDILLPDTALRTTYTLGGGVRDIMVAAPNGSVDLGESFLRSGQDLVVSSGGDLTMTRGTLQADNSTNNEGLTLNAGGNIRLGDTNINFLDPARDPYAPTTPVTTGSVDINSGGTVEFGDSRIVSSRDLEIDATGLIDFGSSMVDLDTGGFDDILVTTTGGSIDLGESNWDVNSTSSGGGLDLIFQAATGISATSSSNNTMLVDGAIEFRTTTGDVSLQNVDLTSLRGGGITLEAVDSASTPTGGGSIFLPNTLDSADNINLTAWRDITTSGTVMEFRDPATFTALTGDVVLGASAINQAAVAASTGELTVTAGGEIDLGSSQIETRGTFDDDVDLTAAGDIRLGSSIITVDANGGPTTITSTGGSVDLGTSQLDLDSSAATSADLLISALGDIVAAAPNNTILVDGAIEFRTTTGDVSLQNVDLTSLRGGGITLEAVDSASTPTGGGSIFLPNTLDSADNINLTAWRDITTSGTVMEFRDPATFTALTGDVVLGASAINQAAVAASTGELTVTAGGEIDLGSSQIETRGTFDDDVDLTAAGDIRLGSSIITVDANGGPTTITSTGGSVDLGTSQLDLDSSAATSADLLISALGDIVSAAPNGSNPANTVLVDGDVSIISNNGSVILPNWDLDMVRIGSDLLVRAGDGSINLGQSSMTGNDGALLQAQGLTGDIIFTSAHLDFDENVRLEAANGDVLLGTGSIVVTDPNQDLEVFAGGTLDASSVTLTVPDRLALLANGQVLANGSAVSASDIEIFGFDPATLAPDVNRAVAQGVTLGLVTADNIDLSVLATGDINISHTGGGSITTERLGLEGNGGSGSPSSIKSTGGDVTLVSDGTINLGKSGSDNGDAFVRSEAAAAVTIQAATINSVVSGTGTLDAQSNGTVSIVGPTSTQALEVSAPGVTVDLSLSPSASSRVNIVGDSDFLNVAGNLSDIEVTELISGNQLTVKPQTSDRVLSVDPLSIEGILYTDQVGVALGTINTTSAQTLAVRVENGGSITEALTGFALNTAGDLLLSADGNVGTAAAPITVPGGRLSVVSGGEVNIQTTASDLVVSDVRLLDPLGNEMASGEGIEGSSDVSIRLNGTGALLTQEQDIRSTSADVAIDIEDGQIVQSAGPTNPAPTISAKTLALSVSGDIGSFDGSTDVPIRVQVDSVVLDGGADVILEQANGDLEVVGQKTIGGNSYTTTGAAGDLRLVAGSGDLTVSTDLTVGGETALVTGTDLTINPQLLPGSVSLNGSITSGQNLVILSNGDIVQNSGILAAPAIGLGANGTVGSPGQPINIATDELALNPSNGSVSDSNGFTQVESVSAVGVTVNQGVPIVPEPPVDPTPGPVEPPETGPGFSTFNPSDFEPKIQEFEDPTFAQNNPDLVEDALREMLHDEVLEFLEPDPTALPLGWFSDEDFLRRKFRR